MKNLFLAFMALVGERRTTLRFEYIFHKDKKFLM